jgi:hypothetical protein
LTWVTNGANEFNPAVAMSADGARMVVASYLQGAGADFYGGIQYSVDSGATWHLSDTPTNWNWSAVACSTNGNFMEAVGETVTNWSDPGPIYSSTNSGVNWKPTSAPLQAWHCVACSSDGSKITAGALGDGGSIRSRLYSSTDHGATWFENDTIASNTNVLGLAGVAASADGNLLVGGAEYILINPPLGGTRARPPNLTIAFIHPASVVVSWPAIGSYSLQQNPHLSPTNWTASTNRITTANNTNNLTITPPTGNLFFRLSDP